MNKQRIKKRINKGVINIPSGGICDDFWNNTK